MSYPLVDISPSSITSHTPLDFVSLLMTAVKTSDYRLFSLAIDHYHFASIPEIIPCPASLLAHVELSQQLTLHKRSWLTYLLLSSCNSENLSQISHRILGTELVVRKLKIAVYCQHAPFLNNILSNIKKELNSKWSLLEFDVIGSTNSIDNYNDIALFDVIVFFTSNFCVGEILNKFIEEGKGLVLFSSNPFWIKGFEYLCLRGGTWGFLKKSKKQCLMEKQVESDILFSNLETVSTNYGRSGVQLTQGEVIARVNGNTPLIVKHDTGRGRIVEFNCPPWSSTVNSYANWSIGGSVAITNAIIWVSNVA
ncbi:hypothetical protein P9112_004919 [Eukaryota sp. TZLM1-RC]